jgi:hypothetical protein
MCFMMLPAETLGAHYEGCQREKEQLSWSYYTLVERTFLSSMSQELFETLKLEKCLVIRLFKMQPMWPLNS